MVKQFVVRLSLYLAQTGFDLCWCIGFLVHRKLLIFGLASFGLILVRLNGAILVEKFDKEEYRRETETS